MRKATIALEELATLILGLMAGVMIFSLLTMNVNNDQSKELAIDIKLLIEASDVMKSNFKIIYPNKYSEYFLRIKEEKIEVIKNKEVVYNTKFWVNNLVIMSQELMNIGGLYLSKDGDSLTMDVRTVTTSNCERIDHKLVFYNMNEKDEELNNYYNSFLKDLTKSDKKSCIVLSMDLNLNNNLIMEEYGKNTSIIECNLIKGLQKEYLILYPIKRELREFPMKIKDMNKCNNIIILKTSDIEKLRENLKGIMIDLRENGGN